MKTFYKILLLILLFSFSSSMNIMASGDDEDYADEAQDETEIDMYYVGDNNVGNKKGPNHLPPSTKLYSTKVHYNELSSKVRIDNTKSDKTIEYTIFKTESEVVVISGTVASKCACSVSVANLEEGKYTIQFIVNDKSYVGFIEIANT